MSENGEGIIRVGVVASHGVSVDSKAYKDFKNRLELRAQQEYDLAKTFEIDDIRAKEMLVHAKKYLIELHNKSGVNLKEQEIPPGCDDDTR